MQRSVVLSTVVKATVASVEFAVGLLVGQVLRQRSMLNLDSENEIVAAKQKKKKNTHTQIKSILSSP